MADAESAHHTARDQLHPELFAKLQRQLCLIEGREVPHGEEEAMVKFQAQAALRSVHISKARATSKWGQKPDPRRKWRTVQPFAPLTYCPEGSTASSSHTEAHEVLDIPAMQLLQECFQGTLRDLDALLLSENVTIATEVFAIMEEGEAVDDGEDENADDYLNALQSFLSVDTMNARGGCKVVNLIDLAETDIETASTCSSLETQEPFRALESIEQETQEKEIQYLQQRLADAHAERDIAVAAAMEDVQGKDEAIAALVGRKAELKAAGLDLRKQVEEASVDAGHWRQKVVDLQTSNDELRRAAQQALRALYTPGAR